MKGLLAQFPGRRSSWAVIGVWVVLVAIFAPFGSKIPNVTNDEYVLPGGSQTARLHQVLRDRFPGGDLRPALIVYRDKGGLTPADKTAIAAEAGAVAGIAKVAQPIAPFPAQPSTANLVSANGEVAITIVPIKAGKIFHVIPTVDAIRSKLPTSGPLEAHVTGFPGITADYNGAIKDADFKLLGATVVLVLLLLIAVYRSPILALVPLIVVGVAYSIVTGIVYLLNRGTGLAVDSSSTSLLLVLMFGAGTDYCLLLVSRYGARLRRTESAPEALRQAIPEAVPPMVASGVTVIAALLTTLAGVFGVFRTFGPVTAIGIAVVLLSGLTLLPAILSLLGRRAYWPSAASVASGGAADPERGSARWRAIGMRVRRQPAVFFSVSVIFLLVCASGLTLWKTDLDPLRQFRKTNDSSQGYEILKSAFPPGTVNPTSLLVDRAAGPLQPADLAAVSGRVKSVPGVARVLDTGQRSTDGRAAILSMIFTDDPFSPKALDRAQEVRDVVAGSVVPGVHVLVGDGSAERLDARIAQSRDTKVIVPFVLLVVLTTLILLLRALVAPLFLLATVVLSYAATLGLTVAIFRYVFGQHGFHSAMPLIIFIFLVALGSDYNIFLMSRVREEATRYGTREGMLNAVAATGPVITSAGLVLAGTFAVLTIIPSWDLSLIGFAVALGVLLDTFLVRSICVPALTWLVGEKSWWPSSAEDGRKATLVTSVFTTQELLGVERAAELGPPPSADE
ncbi:MAG TPA: MMPL family transporter [Gaiellaceae bacterium]|nr:MMPL family transporter [Gaiellaceae bacterium]